MRSINTITVGIDGSEASSGTLEWAAREAAKRKAVLRIVRAFSIQVYGGGFEVGLAPPPVDIEALRAEIERDAAGQVVPIRERYPELEIDLRIIGGGPAGVILEAAEDADLVAVGTRGAGSLAALFIGSVARAVAHRAICPAVIVPSGPVRSTVRSIVVGSDGSPASVAAIDWACREAVLWDAELTVAHVWEYPYVGTRTGVTEPRELMELDAAEALAHDIRSISQRVDRPEHLHARLLEGAPATSLVNFAADADLLVLGPRGRGAVRSALLGSTSAYAISHARCPIAIIHT